MKRECVLQIQQNIRFQEREWRLQRLGWIVFVAIVIAAVLGLFGGGGVFAQKRIDTGTGFALEFSRFERSGAFTKLRIDAQPNGATQNEFSIWIDRQYLHDFDIENITPTPVRSELTGETLSFVFSTRARNGEDILSGTNMSSEANTYRITFTLNADRFGIVEGKIGLVDNANTTIRFRQLFYP